jgi:hypothetical protein
LATRPFTVTLPGHKMASNNYLLKLEHGGGHDLGTRV